MKHFLLLVAGFFFLACEEKTPSQPAAPRPIPPPPTAVVKFEIPGYKSEWSAKVKAMLTDARLAQFNRAQDDFTKRFCPGFKSLSADGQRLAWGHLVGAISRFESGYKPATVYRESNGAMSEGLFQLTYGDRFCPKKKADGDLHDPLVNIECAMKIMERFLAEDGVVASGGYTQYGAPAAKGLARYWSVVRVPDKKSKHYLAEIIAMTKKAPGC